jgi:hypothetical protein
MVVLFVSTLAFLLASFPARTSDLWMHLANGRLLAQGEYSFGADAGINHAWLYDILCYGLYSGLGGPGLVLFKALLVVGLALLLLHLSWSGQGWWAAAFCTALVLLAMSTRLLLQPATISYFLLALTLWLLWPHPGKDETEKPPSSFPLPPWPLLVLFVIWVNMDSWFVLGLGTVALVWLGQVLDEALADRGPQRMSFSSLLRPVFTFALLAVVCLLNPSHVHVFELPPDLAWSGPAGSLASGRTMSPFGGVFLATFGLRPSGLAYYSLLVLGLLSFVLNLPRWHWQRFLPWLGLAFLSAFQVRAVPFFAVLAGPVLAWNLQELLVRHFDPRQRNQPIWERTLLAGRVLMGVLGLVLLVCAWPGWLQGKPYEPRRWAVETPPSLERGAATIRRWHQEGKLGPDSRGLYLSRETAYAFAWFCPEEKGMLVDDLTSAVLGASGSAGDWRVRMRAAGIDHVILYDPDRGRLLTALDGLLADPEQWPLLCVEGDLAIFGWRDLPKAGAHDPFRSWQLDLNELAFRPSSDKKAPATRPDQESRERPWWAAFWKPAPPASIDSDEAKLHLFHAEALRRSALRRHLAAWEASQSAALVGAAGGWGEQGNPLGGLLNAHVRLVLLRPQVPAPGSKVDTLPGLARVALALQNRFGRQRDDTPPALLYLAVRAARRALAVNPADAKAYLSLGESYLRLFHSTRERAWSEQLPELAQLRRAQASAALNQAVSLKPDFAQAHLSLVELYREMGYLDLALQHLRTYLQLIHEGGPSRESDAEQLREQEARLQEELSQLAKVVDGALDSYTVASSGKPVVDRALLARQKGLAGKARDLLLESDVAAFGSQGMALELELLLRTGRAKDVRDWTDSEQKAALGASSYHWLRAQALAASGEYDLAQEECVELANSLTLTPLGKEPVNFRRMIAQMIGQAVLDEQPGGGNLIYLLRRPFARAEFPNQIAGFARGLRREADVTVLRGLIALEEGEVDAARDSFRTALALWKDEASAASGAGLDFNGRVIAQGCLEWLK